MTEMKLGCWFVLVIFCLSACDKTDESPSMPDQQDAEIQVYLEQDTTIQAKRDEAGFYYIPLRDTITPNSGDILSIYFRIWTLDSTLVDQHRKVDGEPIKLFRGDSTVYPLGLDAGLMYMSKGDRYGFVFPSHLAYRDLGVNEVLPPHSVVLFEIEVVDVENDGNIFNSDLSAIEDFIEEKEYDEDLTHPVIDFPSGLRMYSANPDSLAQPVNQGDRVGINWEGSFLNGGSFGGFIGNDIFEFTIGEDEVIAGLEEGVKNMRLGETVILMIPSELAYGPSVAVIPPSLTDILVENEIVPTYGATIPPFTPLVFEVTLRAIE